MLLWNSPRRSGSCWMLLRGPCIGKWCRRTIVTSSQWVRKSSLSVTPSSLHFLSQLLEFVKSPIGLNISFVLGVKVMNPFWVPENYLCPHALHWYNLNLPSLCGTFLVLLLNCTSLSFRVAVFQAICIIFFIFLLIGYCVNKPNAVFKLKQGKEPWILEVEFPRRNYPGKLEIITCEEVGAFDFWNFFFSGISF